MFSTMILTLQYLKAKMSIQLLNVEIAVEEKYVLSIIKYLENIPTKYVNIYPFIQQGRNIMKKKINTTEQSKLVSNDLPVIFQQ